MLLCTEYRGLTFLDHPIDPTVLQRKVLGLYDQVLGLGHDDRVLGLGLGLEGLVLVNISVMKFNLFFYKRKCI